MISSTYLHVLRKIYPLLSACPHPWVITGSFGMALQGMEVEVHDIDLQTNQAGAYEIERLFAEYVKEPVRFSASDQIRSHFGALEIDGVKVEIMGDLQKRPAPEYPGWEDPVRVEDHRCWVDLEDMHIPVLTLEYEYQAYLKLGRTEKAAQIQRWLERNQPQPSPFVSIWFQPRQTIRRIVDTDPKKYVLPLALLSGIEEVWRLILTTPQKTDYPWTWMTILIASLTIGSLLGLIQLYAGGEIYRWLGSLGNPTKATSAQVRAALAWSYLPYIPVALLYNLYFLINDGNAYKNSSAVSLLAVLGVMAGVWSLVILLNALCEVHRIAGWEASLLVLVVAVLEVPILLMNEALGLFLGYVLVMAVIALIAIARRN